MEEVAESLEDNATAHNALLVKKFLPDTRSPIFEHPPNSRIWYPVTYLFSKMKSVLKGTHFPSVNEVKAKTAQLVNGLGVDEL